MNMFVTLGLEMFFLKYWLTELCRSSKYWHISLCNIRNSPSLTSLPNSLEKSLCTWKLSNSKQQIQVFQTCNSTLKSNFIMGNKYRQFFFLNWSACFVHFQGHVSWIPKCEWITVVYLPFILSSKSVAPWDKQVVQPTTQRWDVHQTLVCRRSALNVYSFCHRILKRQRSRFNTINNFLRIHQGLFLWNLFCFTASMWWWRIQWLLAQFCGTVLIC